MPQKNLEFGKLGARGIKGSDAAAHQLDGLIDFIETPVTARRGLIARLDSPLSGHATGCSQLPRAQPGQPLSELHSPQHWQSFPGSPPVRPLPQGPVCQDHQR